MRSRRCAKRGTGGRQVYVSTAATAKVFRKYSKDVLCEFTAVRLPLLFERSIEKRISVNNSTAGSMPLNRSPPAGRRPPCGQRAPTLS